MSPLLRFPLLRAQICSVLLLTLAFAQPASGQLAVDARIKVSGIVAAVKPAELTINLENGEALACKIQDKNVRAISLGGRPTRFPAAINVHGKLPINLADRGMLVRFLGRSNVFGKTSGDVRQVQLLGNDSDEQLKVEFLERPKENKDFAKVEVVGRVINFKGNKLQLKVPKEKWAKRERIYFPMAENAELLVNDDSLTRVVPGDKVVSAEVIKFSNGENVIRSIEIDLIAERSELSSSLDEEMDNQFSDLSDEPSTPRELRSKHFILYTDLSDRSANILLAKLETMYELVSGYFRAAPRLPIECFVVRDLRQWPPGRLDPVGIAKIREPAGVTVSRRMGNGTRAIVYACDDHGVVQHEAVHAFCAQTFGSTGPTWYSEGMAEMGNYWKPGNLEVDIDPVVINYLTNARAKKMKDIVAAGQITGDSWQAYAWRWALCHLLASNPNYSKRFKTLGVNLMSGKEDSFDLAFGKFADEISFEYDQFIQNFGNGYRVDLCVWDWRTRALPMSASKLLKHNIKARAGWQATKMLAKSGQSYDFVTQGLWRINPQTEVDADGNQAGEGRLIGAIFKDYQLSEPFELGTRGSFRAPMDGQLFVRCREDWTGLSDNEEAITLHLRKSRED